MTLEDDNWLDNQGQDLDNYQRRTTASFHKSKIPEEGREEIKRCPASITKYLLHTEGPSSILEIYIRGY